MKQILSVLCLALCPAQYIAAQHANDTTLNRTVVVENQYNPEVMDAFKINVLPKVEEPTVEKKDIEYASSTRPLTAWPFVPMDIVSQPQQQQLAQRGYFRAAYGNRNNVDVKGSFLMQLSDADQLGVMASVYGFSGELDSYNNARYGKWKSRFFRTDVSANYNHDAENFRFLLGGNFASQVFSYMPSYTSLTAQHFTMGDGYIGFASRKDAEPVEFGIKAGFKLFNASHALPEMSELKEKHLWFTGFMTSRIDEQQKAAIELSVNGLTYDGDESAEAWQPNYLHLKANPWYEMENDAMRLHVGAKVAWQNKAGSGLMLAPDVQFDLTFANTYQFFIHADGGAEMNTMRRLNQLSPYWFWCPSTAPLYSTNTAVDAKLGVKGSPRSGVSFRLLGGYRYVQDELFVNALPFAESSIWEYESMAGGRTVNNLYSSFIGQNDASVFYLNAAFCYGYKDRVNLSVEGTYNSWSAKGESRDKLLYLKPELQFDFSFRAKVYRELYAQIKYQYESRTNVSSESIRAAAISNLAISAGYEFANRLNLFARLDNVLNQRYLTSTGYPVQGFGAMGGLSIRF